MGISAFSSYIFRILGGVNLRILLTNDDGINAPGIRALWQELSQYAEVFVVAPDCERSAASQSITVHHPIRVDEYTVDNYPAISAWQIGGTPTDCVKIALEALLISPPDIIVSGINKGANLGTDVLYSGTVSAAIEGALHCIPSIAVSLDTSTECNFEPAARVTGRLIKKISPNLAGTPNILLNVNIPNTNTDSQDFSITKLGERFYENTFDRREDPRGRSYYWIGGNLRHSSNSADTDIAAIEAGKVSITPIHFDLTNYAIMDLVHEWTR